MICRLGWQRKSGGEKIERPERAEPSNVVNLTDALRANVKGGKSNMARRKPARAHHWTSKKAGRSSARHRKAG
jgi:non-homologous end joining protein Ku